MAKFVPLYLQAGRGAIADEWQNLYLYIYKQDEEDDDQRCDDAITLVLWGMTTNMVLRSKF